MSSESSEEKCPACSVGTLVHVERHQDGADKHFSCGHTHVERGVADSFSFSERVFHRVLGFLKGGDTRSIQHIEQVGAAATLASMQQEMYLDAIFFFHEARKYDALQKPFEAWRNLRASLLFSFGAIEACINQAIREAVDRNRATLTPGEVDHWMERTGYISIEEKLKGGIRLIGGKPFADDFKVWGPFLALKDLRDGLLHYKPGEGPYYRPEFLFEVQKGIGTAADIIQRINLAPPNSPGYPVTFDQLP